MRISAIISAIEAFAKPSLQEKWDNTGLQVGNPMAECEGVLVCLDLSPAVVEEAISHGCNLIVSHHPLFFKPIKRLTGRTAVEATAMNAIAAGISIYSTHTAIDSAKGGVSYEMARRLGVSPLRTLAPAEGTMVRLQTYVPANRVAEVQAAIFDAGAGSIGNYDCCCFTVKGEGTFRAKDGASPYVGEIGLSHSEAETKIEAVLPAELMAQVESALLEAHPYETPAYSFTPMLNKETNLGLGVYGVMEEGMPMADFIEHVKATFGCKTVRTSKVDLGADAKIRRVALCGGAGGEFIGNALAMGAQAYVTADIRYHDFVDYRDRILLIDAGHYETEAPVKEVIRDIIVAKFPDIKAVCATSDDNPINYL